MRFDIRRIHKGEQQQIMDRENGGAEPVKGSKPSEGVHNDGRISECCDEELRRESWMEVKKFGSNRFSFEKQETFKEWSIHSAKTILLLLTHNRMQKSHSHPRDQRVHYPSVLNEHPKVELP